MMDMEIRRYVKEQYACHLWIKRKRLDGTGQLRDADGVAVVMTKWLARCVRNQLVVIGSARVTAHHDLMTDLYALRAVAYAFRDVPPEDREALTMWVDNPNHHAVEIPVFSEVRLS